MKLSTMYCKSCKCFVIKLPNSSYLFYFQHDFVNFVGGNNSKDHIVRVYKRTFRDDFAVKWSWQGMRNNIRICDMKSISIIKGNLRTSFYCLHHLYLNAVNNTFININCCWENILCKDTRAYLKQTHSAYDPRHSFLDPTKSVDSSKGLLIPQCIKLAKNCRGTQLLLRQAFFILFVIKLKIKITKTIFRIHLRCLGLNILLQTLC